MTKRSTGWKQRGWAKYYRQRIIDRKEYCRECGRVSPFLTFGHMIPASQGGPATPINLTILCKRCQQRQRDNIWPHQVSLLEEILEDPVLPDWVECSPDTHNRSVGKCLGCLHREYQENKMGLKHSNSHPARRRSIPINFKTLEKQMGTPVPSPTQITNTIADRIGKLESNIVNLTERLEILEAARPFSRDDASQPLVDFLMKFPGVKFNTGSIAGNVNSNSLKISDKLKQLAIKGIISTSKQDGQSTMYWYEPAMKVNVDGTYSGVTAQMEGE